MALETHFPVFVGFGQFGPYILPFEKQANRIRTREMLCIPQKLVERRAGAGRNDIEGLRQCSLHALVADDRIETEPVAHHFEESAFLGGGLEECDPDLVLQQHCENQCGEARAASQVYKRRCCIGNISRELRTIPNVALPNVRKGCGRNQIVPRVPILKHPDIGLKLGHYFT